MSVEFTQKPRSVILPEGVVDEAELRFIAPKLWPLAVRIETVKLHPRNPNVGDVDSIAESVLEFTQYAPIVVQESTNYIAKGNHTYQAMERVGSAWIAVVPMAWDETTTLAVLAGDNRHSEKAVRQIDQLAAILKELDAQEKLAGTGYSPDDVADIIAQLDATEDVDLSAFADDAPAQIAYRVEIASLTRERAIEIVDLLQGEGISARMEQYRTDDA